MKRTLKFWCQTRALLLTFVLLPATAYSELEVDFLHDLDLNAVVATGTSWVTVDNSGGIWRTESLEAELEQVYSGEEELLALAHSGGALVAVGRNGWRVRSVDAGASWTEVGEPVLGDLRGVAYGGGNWVAVGSNEQARATVWRSGDGGASWSAVYSRDDSLPGEFTAVSWTGTEFTAVGGDSFDGWLYASSNGSTWSEEALPSGVGYLEFVVSDGSGNVLAGGELGQLVQGTAGDFELLSADVSETLTAGYAAGAGSWLIGGEQALVLQLEGVEVSFLQMPLGRAPRVRALLLIEEEVLALGHFVGYFEDPELRLQALGNGRVLITLVNPQPGRGYVLESSADLANWAVDTDASDEEHMWEREVSEPRQFYRVSAE